MEVWLAHSLRTVSSTMEQRCMARPTMAMVACLNTNPCISFEVAQARQAPGSMLSTPASADMVDASKACLRLGSAMSSFRTAMSPGLDVRRALADLHSKLGRSGQGAGSNSHDIRIALRGLLFCGAIPHGHCQPELCQCRLHEDVVACIFRLATGL